MGSFNVAGFISNSSISPGDDIIFMALLPRQDITEQYIGRSFAGDITKAFQPLTLPIFCKYDDYGGITDIVHTPSVEWLQRFFECDIDDLVASLTGNVRSDENEALHDKIVNIYEDATKHYPNTFVGHPAPAGTPLYNKHFGKFSDITCVFEHAEIYQKMLDIAAGDISSYTCPPQLDIFTEWYKAKKYQLMMNDKLEQLEHEDNLPVQIQVAIEKIKSRKKSLVEYINTDSYAFSLVSAARGVTRYDIHAFNGACNPFDLVFHQIFKDYINDYTIGEYSDMLAMCHVMFNTNKHFIPPMAGPQCGEPYAEYTLNSAIVDMTRRKINNMHS